jgi:tRNA(Ile)-lysidine synthase
MSAMGSIVAAARRVIAGRPVLAAVGGGADSAVACWAALEAGSTVRAAFVDHGLPGSQLLERTSGALCARLGIGRDVLAGPVGDGPDLENRARSVRRALLLGLLAEGEALLTGHTMTDQAETVLLHLLRGAGARGLSAMREEEWPTVRPLLGFTRGEIRMAAAELGLPFGDDPGNADPRFVRNRLRHEVMPLLDAIRPGSEAAIARAARSLAADDEHLRSEASTVPLVDDGGAVLIPRAVLAAVDRAVAARVVLGALRRVDARAGSERDVDAVLGTSASGAGPAQLSGGRLADVEGPYVSIAPQRSAAPGEALLPVPGSVVFGTHRLQIGSSAASPGPGLILDPARLPGALLVRAARAGDRIAVRDGSKLVNDALAEAGVPRRARPVWPVVVAGAKIAAVPGARVAWWARPAGADSLTLIDERVPG